MGTGNGCIFNQAHVIESLESLILKLEKDSLY